MKAGTLYFAAVFGVGFAVAPLRILWAEPRFGTRAAELAEMPLMLVVMVVAARWIVRHLPVADAVAARLKMGAIALALMLAAEFGLVLGLRGISLAEYFASRDPVAGTVYYAMLALFAAMPLLVGRARA